MYFGLLGTVCIWRDVIFIDLWGDRLSTKFSSSEITIIRIDFPKCENCQSVKISYLENLCIYGISFPVSLHIKEYHGTITKYVKLKVYPGTSTICYYVFFTVVCYLLNGLASYKHYWRLTVLYQNYSQWEDLLSHQMLLTQLVLE